MTLANASALKPSARTSARSELCTLLPEASQQLKPQRNRAARQSAPDTCALPDYDVALRFNTLFSIHSFGAPAGAARLYVGLRAGRVAERGGLRINDDCVEIKQ